MAIFRSNILKFASTVGKPFYSAVGNKRGHTSVPNIPILYGDEASPPVRFVLMIAAHLKVDLDFQRVDLFQSEHKTDSYRAINPLQKVPALKLDKDIICDSHAIVLYLCETAKSKDLYPLSALSRAKINQMLFYNATTLFPIDSRILSEYFSGKLLLKDNLDEWFRSLAYLNTQLSVSLWLAGDEMTICDLCCAATISSMETVVDGVNKFAHLKKWMNALQILPCFEINRNGVERLKHFIHLYK